MSFKVGDKVTFVDEAIDGVVISVSSKCIGVETEDGFEVECNRKEIAKRSFDNDMSNFIDDNKLSSILEEKNADNVKRSNNKSQKKNNDNLTVIDLHIEKLKPNYHNLDRFDILEHQLSQAEYVLNKAMKTGKSGIVFIHGYGDGILRDAIHRMLRNNYKLHFHDANYVKYGEGATEAIFI
ncbi:MAG: Smr/MutS family protein [Ichthyobacteriaceae bacterium]|nr:Smr/MutS family protein [Ichthyobacteriaceae bacterium]